MVRVVAFTFKNYTVSLAANKLIKLQCYQSLQNHPTGPLSNCNLHLFPSLLACREGKCERRILAINEEPSKHEICE